MKVFLLLTALLLLVLLADSFDGEEHYAEIMIVPSLRYYDSDGRKISFPAENKGHRVIRERKTCEIPRNLPDSQLLCKFYPSGIACNQTCMFGHRLCEGIWRKMMCLYEENKWTPTPTFERCKPFVDCSIKFVEGGAFKCLTSRIDRGPICKIKCFAYIHVPVLPSAIYECDIEGKWHPTQPRCIGPSGVNLEPVPEGSKIGNKL